MSSLPAATATHVFVSSRKQRELPRDERAACARDETHYPRGP